MRATTCDARSTVDAEPTARPSACDGLVRLVPLYAADGAFYRALYTDADVMRHAGGPLSARDADAAFAAVCRQVSTLPPRAWYWRVQRTGEGGHVPAAGLAAVVADAGDGGADRPSAELGVVLATSAQATGLATAAIVAVAAEMFTRTPMQRLWTRHADTHAAAAALMRTLGFQQAHPAGPVRRWQLAREHWARDPSLGRARRDGAR